ncbi:Beta-xylanase [Mycena kentingensis (nom. inval.)]|nr:Beta-xylanase [Mycena kentingensis (nom. inval.)]
MSTKSMCPSTTDLGAEPVVDTSNWAAWRCTLDLPVSWLGLHSPYSPSAMRLSLASVLLAVTLVSSAVVVDEREEQPAKRQAAQSIDTLFKNHGKVFFGTAADQNRLSVSQDAAITAADFGGVTPENSMKWDTIEPSRGSFNFGQFDFLVNWATTNNKKIRGHTFVWAQQLPSWVQAINDAPTLTTVLQNHITQIMTRYKGKMYAVDVVNEHINEDGSIKSTHWTQVLGNNVFTIAFQTARQVDPSVKLYINDFNLDSNNAKVAGIVRLVNQINSGGQKLVDGIGTQMHLSAGGSGGAQAALTALAATGLDVAITELDIAGGSSTDYTNVVRACLNVPKCVGITVWGVRDPDSWRPTTNCLLFDANWQPKPAYNGILDDDDESAADVYADDDPTDNDDGSADWWYCSSLGPVWRDGMGGADCLRVAVHMHSTQPMVLPMSLNLRELELLYRVRDPGAVQSNSSLWFHLREIPVYLCDQSAVSETAGLLLIATSANTCSFPPTSVTEKSTVNLSGRS